MSWPLVIGLAVGMIAVIVGFVVSGNFFPAGLVPVVVGLPMVTILVALKAGRLR